MEVENENENKIKIWAEAKPKTSVEVYDVSRHFVQEFRDVVAEDSIKNERPMSAPNRKQGVTDVRSR
ncbi:hypothetical protein G6F37_006822 [Rhizopus arrhizus]|nr:hypothetical protein G6F38_000039 [Rhizopus arrhizus]KAG1157310.1 hypothetical protein G6F37_006822 [Rhizopus arrhizus]